MNSADKKPTPRLPRPVSRLRRYAAAVGSLALAGTLVIAGLVSSGGVEQTDAAWTDTEHAQAAITAEWPEAFASVVAGSVKSADSMVNSDDMTYESVFRWTTQMSEPASTPTAETTTPMPNYSREWDQRYRGPGVAVNDTGTPNNLGPVDNNEISLHNWYATRDFSNPNLLTIGTPRGGQTRPRNFRCLAIHPNMDQGQHCGHQNSFSTASNTTDAFGFSVASGNAFRTFLNAANLSTSVSCTPDSAVANAPIGRIDLGTEQGTARPYLSYGSFTRHVRTVWAAGQNPHSNGFDLSSGQISDMWNIGAVLGVPTDPWARVMPVITQLSSAPGEQPYAISEIAAYVEVYNTNLLSSDELRAKMYFVLSRSECGVRRPGPGESLAEQRPVFPEELPGGNGLEPYPSEGDIWEPTAETASRLRCKACSRTKSQQLTCHP